MKMQFSMWERATFQFKIVEGKNMHKAFREAIKLFGANGFTDFKRHFEKPKGVCSNKRSRK
jgi:hypothetical protein